MEEILELLGDYIQSAHFHLKNFETRHLSTLSYLRELHINCRSAKSKVLQAIPLSVVSLHLQNIPGTLIDSVLHFFNTSPKQLIALSIEFGYRVTKHQMELLLEAIVPSCDELKKLQLSTSQDLRPYPNTNLSIPVISLDSLIEKIGPNLTCLEIFDIRLENNPMDIVMRQCRKLKYFALRMHQFFDPDMRLKCKKLITMTKLDSADIRIGSPQKYVLIAKYRNCKLFYRQAEQYTSSKLAAEFQTETDSD
ncbi:hypothetical protein HDE_12218 [Halotydeus destructor]|nr:hypothetical protein HDE_12218 [Halotydeus destructor]